MRCCHGKHHRQPGFRLGVAERGGTLRVAPAAADADLASAAASVGHASVVGGSSGDVVADSSGDVVAAPGDVVADSSVDVAVAAPSINWKSTLGLRVYNQFECGNCWVICSIGLMESLLKIAGRNESLSIQFCNDFCEPGFEAKDSLKTKFLRSIGFTVSCEGGSPGACLDFLTDVGVPRAADYRQYLARNRSSLEIAYDKWLYGDPEKFRLKRVANMGVDIGNLVDESAILAFASWLTHRGPAVTAVKCCDWGRDSLDSSFMYVGDYEQEFKHCLLVVGFKWKERLWTLLNSHGESYGDSGLFYIRFEDTCSGFGEIFHVANF